MANVIRRAIALGGIAPSKASRHSSAAPGFVRVQIDGRKLGSTLRLLDPDSTYEKALRAAADQMIEKMWRGR